MFLHDLDRPSATLHHDPTERAGSAATVQVLAEAYGLTAGVRLASVTTWQVGGPARWFYEPRTVDDLVAVLDACCADGVPVFYLGRGSNVLVADEGLDGVVICTRKSLQGYSVSDGVITAEAGVPLPKLAKVAASCGQGGFEFLIGIPGTVGGGLVMNAGVGGFLGSEEIRSVVLDADVYIPGQGIRTLSLEELDLSYRSSRLQGSNAYVLRARFRADGAGDPEEIRKRTTFHLVERKRKQPLTKPTAGSTFKQPEGGEPAGWYLDRAGLKGARVGGAVVSPMHANWIENDGTATARDIRLLMEHMERQVEEHFGIRLEREVRFLPLDAATAAAL